MPARLKVSPTKSNLLVLRRQVDFLEQGHTLLERKRELLTRLVYERLADYRKLRARVRQAVHDAYRSLAVTQLRMSERVLEQIPVGIEPALSVRILPRSSLGVEYPSVSATRAERKPVGLLWTDASLDTTRERMTELVLLLAKLGEAETALQRIVAEQRKTQKRVNALRYNVIPSYRETIRWIDGALEEEERNTLFQMKVLRDRDHGI